LWGHNILREGVFVTELFSDVGISVWRIVWTTTNCCFMSHIQLLATLRHTTTCYDIHALLHDTSSTRLLICEQIMLYYHLSAYVHLILQCYIIRSVATSNLSEHADDDQLFLRLLRVPYRDAVTTASGV
jgi:hypothetical protein